MIMTRQSRLAAAALLLIAGVPACNRGGNTGTPVSTAPVTRRDIVVSAEANGVVEPINVVEVKSKASGLIRRMPVETGTLVKPGDLIAQVDTRDVQNQYNQADADVKAAEARAQVSLAQKKRSDEMFSQRVITAQEHESAALDYANAQANLVRTRASLDLARQRLEDATVTAPVAGTVIEKAVSQGMVITSATGAFGGGTTLIKMADLTRVRLRAQFNETDIGQIRPGQVASVTVDAYPDRRFNGLVEKIEPQAVVTQGVTLFPVLVTLNNQDGALKPGMNGEVSVTIDERRNVLAVPNDAVKSLREAVATAPLLGLNPDSVQAQLRTAFQRRGAPNGAPAGMRGEGVQRGAQQGGGPRQGVARAMTSPGDIALDPRQGAGRDNRAQRGAARGGATRLQLGSPEGGMGPGGAGPRVRPSLVFVAAKNTFEPRVVMLGAGNFDYTEVVSGLQEGDQVALLSALSLQAQRQEMSDRLRQRIGGVPGMSQNQGGRPPARIGRGG